MTRNEQLSFCKVCVNQQFDLQQGILCGLTSQKANFSVSCPSFAQKDGIVAQEKYNAIYNELEANRASTGQRFANWLIDLAGIYVFSSIFGVFLGVFIVLMAPERISVLQGIDTDSKLINYVFGFFIGMIYYLIFEITTGRSLGKFITKTKVVDEEGNKPDAGKIFIRSLCRFIPFEAFSFFNNQASGWHDTLSKTMVVKK